MTGTLSLVPVPIPGIWPASCASHQSKLGFDMRKSQPRRPLILCTASRAKRRRGAIRCLSGARSEGLRGWVPAHISGSERQAIGAVSCCSVQPRFGQEILSSRQKTHPKLPYHAGIREEQMSNLHRAVVPLDRYGIGDDVPAVEHATSRCSGRCGPQGNIWIC